MRFLRLLLVVVLIGVLLASQAARFLIVDNAQKSDAIVVLAGETSMRPARALELLRQGMAPRMFLDAEAGEPILIVDNAQKSDAIVVLAGETSMRPARALELLRQGMAPRMFLDAEAGEQIYDQQLTGIAQRYVNRSEEHTSELQSLRHL